MQVSRVAKKFIITMVIFSVGGDGSGGAKQGEGGTAGADGALGKDMVAGVMFRENARAKFEKKAGEAFDKHSEVWSLVVKMEETGEAFELESLGGKAFITGGKDFPETEAELDKLFEVMTKSCNRSSSAFVGTRTVSRTKMARTKGVQKMFVWLRQRQIFVRPTKLGIGADKPNWILEGPVSSGPLGRRE
jgi:hypothetical protein